MKRCIYSHSTRMQEVSDSRKYTSVLHDLGRSREQHSFGNGVRSHVRHVHDMLCASILGTTGHVCTANFENSCRPFLHDVCTCWYEISGALHCLKLSTDSCHEDPDTLKDHRIHQAPHQFHPPHKAQVLDGPWTPTYTPPYFTEGPHEKKEKKRPRKPGPAACIKE
eukprot:218997-Pelagomonas_calceolata.AAC.1